MTVNAEDIARLAGELNARWHDESESHAQAWLEEAGIESDAIAALIDSAQRSTIRKLLGGGDILDVLIDVVGQSFRMGWEVRDQYGRGA